MAISVPMRQIILIGFICFGTIGMFNSLSSIGNAGKHSPGVAQNMVITASSIAYIVGFLVAGGAHNIIGPRICVGFGGITFVLYAGAMMLAGDDSSSVYPPLAGALMGLGAGCIWVTQGAMMMSYPTEDTKGKYIATFWAIFNLGAVLGSIYTLALNNSQPDPDDVTQSTYVAFMVTMALATCLTVFLKNPASIIRENGEPVIVTKLAGIRAETKAILSVFCDWRMLMLIPAFFFSNFSYTYQFNDFNAFNFTIRARSLNSVLFWVAQIIGAMVMGYVLDRLPFRRPKRALLGLFIICVLFMATWIGAFVVQLEFDWVRQDYSQDNLIDYDDHDYSGPLAIYFMFGFCDAAFAVYCYWLMGALSNRHDELSRYAGFFKSIQSLGSAVAAPLDLAQTPLFAYLITNWVLCAFSLAAMFVVVRTITDTTVENQQQIDDEDDYYDASVIEQEFGNVIQSRRPSTATTVAEGDQDGGRAGGRPSMTQVSNTASQTATEMAEVSVGPAPLPIYTRRISRKQHESVQSPQISGETDQASKEAQLQQQQQEQHQQRSPPHSVPPHSSSTNGGGILGSSGDRDVTGSGGATAVGGMTLPFGAGNGQFTFTSARVHQDTLPTFVPSFSAAATSSPLSISSSTPAGLVPVMISMPPPTASAFTFTAPISYQQLHQSMMPPTVAAANQPPNNDNMTIVNMNDAPLEVEDFRRPSPESSFEDQDMEAVDANSISGMSSGDDDDEPVGAENNNNNNNNRRTRRNRLTRTMS